jgi:hypothetical protein
VLALPAVTGELVAQSVDAYWPSLKVSALDVTGFARGQASSVTWISTDAGSTWTVTRG